MCQVIHHHAEAMTKVARKFCILLAPLNTISGWFVVSGSAPRYVCLKVKYVINCLLKLWKGIDQTHIIPSPPLEIEVTERCLHDRVVDEPLLARTLAMTEENLPVATKDRIADAMFASAELLLI